MQKTHEIYKYSIYVYPLKLSHPSLPCIPTPKVVHDGFVLFALYGRKE